MNENEEKYFVSLLFEALGQISELSERLHKLEEQFKELSLNYRNSTEIALSNNNVRSIPISQLNTEPELLDTVKSDIEKAVDYVLKLGKNLPYIINK